MPEMTEAYTWHGRTVIDRDGVPVGTIDEVYGDEITGKPEWALIHTGLFGAKSHLVPLEGASPRGEEVRVRVSKDQVHSAPSLNAGDELSEPQEVALFAHYGVPYARPEAPPAPRSSITVTDGRRSEAELAAPESYQVEPPRVTRSPSEPEAGDALTRSEEELSIGVERRERGRARLRKYVVTEQVTTTVPVQREVVRVEHEPITDENRAEALRDLPISEAEQEVILYEEQPVVEKRVVPKERVRLRTDVVQEEQQVSEQVRKEQIETDSADDRVS